jgi:hypothetical protein
MIGCATSDSQALLKSRIVEATHAPRAKSGGYHDKSYLTFRDTNGVPITKWAATVKRTVASAFSNMASMASCLAFTQSSVASAIFLKTIFRFSVSVLRSELSEISTESIILRPAYLSSKIADATTSFPRTCSAFFIRLSAIFHCFISSDNELSIASPNKGTLAPLV